MVFYSIFTASIAALVWVTAYAALNKSISERIPCLRGGDAEARPLKAGLLWPLTAGIACLGGACAFFLAQHTGDPINLAKMTISLLCLTGAAAVDIREKRIPNIFPAIMAVCGIILLAAGFLTGQKGAVSYALGNTVAAAATGVAFLVLSVLTRQGIGAGDGKLLCAFALIAGPLSLIATVALGTTICAVCAAVLLLSKKKTAKDSLPFGPFLFAGYVMTILLRLY